MDKRLEKALDVANFSATTTAHKKNIINRAKQLQTVFYNSGTFIADREMLAFVALMQTEDSFILLDERNTPIKITDGEEFLAKLKSAYTSATNEMYAEYEKIKRSRSITKLMDL